MNQPQSLNELPASIAAFLREMHDDLDTATAPAPFDITFDPDAASDDQIECDLNGDAGANETAVSDTPQVGTSGSATADQTGTSESAIAVTDDQAFGLRCRANRWRSTPRVSTCYRYRSGPDEHCTGFIGS